MKLKQNLKQDFLVNIRYIFQSNFFNFTNFFRFLIISICVLLLPFWVFNLTTFNSLYAQNDRLINNFQKDSTQKSDFNISNNSQKIFQQPQQNNPNNSQFTTLLVLGAQINSYNDQLSGILSERLEKALEVWKLGRINKILLSGGDREPQVMMNFLEKNGVPKEILFADWGGLRTIDSCWRARNIFKIQRVAVITQEFHLPRATFLCKRVGMEVLPIASENSFFQTQIYGLFREIFACWDSSIDLLNQYKPPIGSDGKEPNLGE